LKSVVKDRPEPGIWVKEFPTPKPDKRELLVRVHRASICGSDIGLYYISAAYAGFAKLPTIPGHEFAGEVAELGDGVTGFKGGERVVAESVLSCGTCKHCINGQSNLCLNFKIFGIHVNGGFSEYVTVPEKHLHHLRDSLSFEEAAVIEPLSVGCHAMNDVARVNLTDTVVVLGPGPIGLLAAQVAKAKGCRDILISGIDVDERRLAIAGNLGFRTFNSSKDSLVESVLKSTGGIGVDVVVVAAGSGHALIQACDLVRKGGKILNIAIYPKPVELTMTNLVRREIALLGTFGSNWKNYEEAMDLAADNRVALRPIVTHSFPIDEAELAFEKAKAREGCKVQLAM
jgi:L-iditol 2-dehydrogenase